MVSDQRSDPQQAKHQASTVGPTVGRADRVLDADVTLAMIEAFVLHNAPLRRQRLFSFCGLTQGGMFALARSPAGSHTWPKGILTRNRVAASVIL